MIKIIFILILLLLPVISGVCVENQININNASLEKLDEIYGIGPVKAQEIIDSRQFQSLNDLLNITGIAELTFNKIIEQGLACIGGEEKIEEEEKTYSSKELKITNFTNEEITIRETIYLNPKTIKTENSNQNVENKGYSKYLIVVFCLILGILYLTKSRKKKNEWR